MAQPSDILLIVFIRLVLMAISLLGCWWIWRVTKPSLRPQYLDARLAEKQTSDSPRTQDVATEKPVTQLALPKSGINAQYSAAIAHDIPKKSDSPSADDPFARRNLEKRKPKSLADLKAHTTPYVSPKLDDGRGDGDVTSIYRGYYLNDDGKLNRIQFGRSPEPNSLSFEGKDGRYFEYTAEKMKLSNFDADPYSLVITVPGGISLYLKFYSTYQPVDPDRIYHRAYEGWIFPSRQPVLLVDGYEPFRDTTDAWPSTEKLQPLMKSRLPEN